jgi:hypothetical protein
MQSIFMQEAQVGSTHLKFSSPKQSELKELADVFNAPFTLFSKILQALLEFQSEIKRENVAFEGGKIARHQQISCRCRVNGVKRGLAHLDIPTKAAYRKHKTVTLFTLKSQDGLG